MEIIPRFKINEIVQHKFQRDDSLGTEAPIAMEVLYIYTETCSAGTQIFYHCRSFFIKGFEFGYSIIDANKPAWKFREDELKPASNGIIDIIHLGKKEAENIIKSTT